MKVKRIFGTALSLCLLLPFSACMGGGESAESGEKETAFYEFRFETDLAEKSEDRYPAAGGGNTYYVSSKGSDENDGLSEETPIKTIKKVNGLQLKAGDTVRFQGRGNVFGRDAYRFGERHSGRSRHFLRLRRRNGKAENRRPEGGRHQFFQFEQSSDSGFGDRRRGRRAGFRGDFAFRRGHRRLVYFQGGLRERIYRQ